MSGEQLGFDWSEPARSEAPSSGTPPESHAPPPRAAALAPRLAALAELGVYVGTSSWKYPGWLGQVYAPARYRVRGRFSQKRFNDECLAEYARVFPTVCGDFAFYQFPGPATWERQFAQVPPGFRFALKVPEDVTVERFPNMPRYGPRAGEPNPNFMDASLVADRLLGPLEPYRDRLGVLIFQFGAIHGGPLADAARFAERLDAFLSGLPTRRFEFAVEVRNRAFLSDGTHYLDCLRSHGVAHCFNSWTRMPPVAEQLDVPGAFTAPHAAARFLLRPGRTYEQAVQRFSPYERAGDAYAEGRAAMRRLLAPQSAVGRRIYVFVNNRLEGNAVETVEAVTA